MSTSSEPFDVESVRRDFPALNRPFESGRHRAGTLPCFLDSAASAQKLQCVIDRERQVEEQFYANAYRGVYWFGELIDEALEESRERVRRYLNAGSSNEIVFTAGTTMSINLVARAWGGKFLEPGDEVLITELEHHANIVPWQLSCAERGAALRWLPITEDGRLDLEQLDRCLTPRTKLVAVTAMSNVLGTRPPLDEIASRVRESGARLLIDAAQSVPHGPLDVQSLGADFVAFSGHKLYGPSGVGVLYGRRELLDAMNPFLGGGHMISQVFRDHSEWAEPPAKFEAGTLPIVQAIALGTAIDYVERLGFERIQAHEAAVLRYAHERLTAVPGLRLLGPVPEHKGAICSFTIADASTEDLANLLDIRGVFVRHGHHCTMPLHERLGIPASVRASFGVYNSQADVDRLADALEFALSRLR